MHDILGGVPSEDLESAACGFPGFFFEVHHPETYRLITQLRQRCVTKSPDILGTPVEAEAIKDLHRNPEPLLP
jgi:hypothetical protein